MIKFTKMHGLGNDFVVIDAVRQKVELSPVQVRKIADRHFGVGCDQLLLVEPAASGDADFHYRIFNADGGEVSQCGNGARCFARFVHEQSLSDKIEVKVDTRAGRMVLRRENDGDITVDMGIPRFDPAQIPLNAEREALSYSAEVEGKTWDFGAVSMGNPHAVLRIDNIDDALVATLGRHWKAIHCSPSAPISVLCRSWTSTMSACGYTSAAVVRPWPAAAGLAGRRWLASCKACLKVRSGSICPAVLCTSVGVAGMRRFS